MNEPAAASQRLDSWKSIADYLNRDVGTVRRWEKELALPVHRVPGGHGRSVFAYRAEIDAWLSGANGESAPPGYSGHPQAPTARGRGVVKPALWLALGVIVFLTGAIGMLLKRRVPTAEAATAEYLVAERLWVGQDVDATGGISRDGRLLSYVDWQRTGNLMVRHLATGKSVAITHKKSWAESSEFATGSAISPDARRIAYGWITATGTAELRLADVTGGPASTAYARPDLEGIWPFDWSPDGKYVAALLVETSARSNLALIHLTAGHVSVLKQFDWRTPDRAFFSRDGHYLAYDVVSAIDVRDRELIVISVTGSEETRPAAHPAEDRVVGWTPQGSLLFASDRTGSPSLWEIPFAGAHAGSSRLLRADFGRVSPVGVTGDGVVVYTVAAKLRELRLAKLDGASAAVIELPRPSGVWLPGGTHEWRTAWSPDGGSIALVPTRGGPRGSPVAVISDAVTGEQRHVPINLESASAFAWARDGNGLYVAGRRRGERGLFHISLTDHSSSTILSNEEIAYVSPSPDGRRVYVSRYGKNPGVLEIDVVSHRRRDIYRGPVWNVAVSPDGRQLAVITQHPSKLALRVLSLDNASDQTLFESGGDGLGALAWSADGERLFFSMQTGDELWCVSLRDRKARSTGIKSEAMSDVSVNPDGARVAISGGTVTSELWRLKGLTAPWPPD